MHPPTRSLSLTHNRSHTDIYIQSAYRPRGKTRRMPETHTTQSHLKHSTIDGKVASTATQHTRPHSMQIMPQKPGRAHGTQLSMSSVPYHHHRYTKLPSPRDRTSKGKQKRKGSLDSSLLEAVSGGKGKEKEEREQGWGLRIHLDLWSSADVCGKLLDVCFALSLSGRSS